MKKLIRCPECKGQGYFTIVTGDRNDYCGVIGQACSSCGGSGALEVDMTRADRIRAMSDEELAAYWFDHHDDFCPNLPECGEMLNQDQEIPAEKCVGCALRWLQEVEP